MPKSIKSDSIAVETFRVPIIIKLIPDVRAVFDQLVSPDTDVSRRASEAIWAVVQTPLIENLKYRYLKVRDKAKKPHRKICA